MKKGFIRNNVVKIILDIIMALLLVLMYRKNAISLSFHELGGLAVCGLFLIHKVLNLNWIKGITIRLFSKTLPARTRIKYILDFLLLLSITFILISGIMISQVYFTWLQVSSSMFWKTGHYFASAASLILVGVHIGLNRLFIKNMFTKVIKIPKAVTKPLGIILLAAVVAYGGYSIATTSFVRWLTAPFTAVTTKPGCQIPFGDGEGFRGMPQDGINIPSSSTANSASDSTTGNSNTLENGSGKPSRQGGNGNAPQNGYGTQNGNKFPDGNGTPNGSGFPGRDGFRGGKGGFERNSPSGFLGILSVIGSYSSIAALFAVITALIDKLFSRRKKQVIVNA